MPEYGQRYLFLVLLMSCYNAFGQQFTRTVLEQYPYNIAQAYVASWGDFNNDNYLDILTNRLYKNYVPLYMNNGNGTFRVDSTIAAGESISSRLRFGALADYDNDCDLDFFGGKVAATNDSIFLYRNRMGTFKQVAFEANFEERNFGAGNWVDYDNDGHLDLYSVRGSLDDQSVLYRNNGDGTFARVANHALVEDCCANSFHSAWADYDNDGDIDAFIANWAGINNFLFRNDGGGTFTKITEGAIVQDGGHSNGASWGDYNNDGYLDLFVANGSVYGEPAFNFLYRNNGNGTFARVSSGAIATDTSDAYGSAWGDYDNDGHVDLFVANFSKSFEAPRYSGYRNLLYHNNGDGTFTRITDEGIAADSSTSGGAAWGDCDNDGDLDLFVANLLHPSLLWINNGNGNNWINLKLAGTVSNRSAIGAVVRLKANGYWQMRHVEALSGTLSQNSLNVELGLGKATLIDSIRIQWPSGSSRILTDVPANQFITIEEDRESLEPPVLVAIDSSNCFTSRIILRVKGVYDYYLWQDGSTNASSVAKASGTYSVVVSNQCQSWTVTKVVEVDPPKALFIPNVITPNGDGFNDSFVINDWLLGARLSIYNRWGKQVYGSDNYQNEWQADHLPNGVYYYNLRHPCLPTALKGWISVLK